MSGSVWMKGLPSGGPFYLENAMASAAVEEIIDGLLRDQWNRCPIFTENEDAETPTDGSPFIITQYPMSDVSRVTISDPCYQETGMIRVSINVARGEGTDTIRSWGTELAAILREKRIGNLVLGVPSEPFTDDASEEGMYFRGQMLVGFTYYFRGD